MQATPPTPAPVKKLVRRPLPDRSQTIRKRVQALFAVLNLCLGVQFFLWVRYFERGGTGFLPSRPAGVEGWLPIAGMMNTKLLFSTGHIPAIHPAAMFLFLAFVTMSLVIKKSFCGWLCPVGTLSEALGKLGRRVLGRNFQLPRWVDLPLRGLKYLLLGFFLLAIGAMSAAALLEFLHSPYGLIADVKMLFFFRHLSGTVLVVLVVLALGSMVVKNFWCRFLCPYGALLGLVSLASPVKIRRDPEACIDCGKCARACPMALPVDRLVRIHSAECTACLECVAVCPAQNALQLALPPRGSASSEARWRGRALSPRTVAAAVAGIFLAVVLFARLTGHWQTELPREIYLRLIPHAAELSHPGM